LTIGAGEGALFTGALAYVLEAAPTARRGRLIGHFGLSMWGGLALGPPLAALVAAQTSPRGALWLAATSGAAAFALTAAGTRRRVAARRATGASVGHAAPARDAAPRVAAANRDAAPRLAAPAHAVVRPARLFPRAAWKPGVVLGLASFGYGTVNAFAVLQAGAGALGVFAAGFLVVRLAGSQLVDDLGPRRVVIASSALEGVALGAVAAGIVPLVPLALAGAALALVFPALAVWVVEAAPERERGTAVGAMTSCWDLGIAAAGPAGALLVAPGRLEPAFLLAAVLAGLAALGAALPRAKAFRHMVRLNEG